MLPPSIEELRKRLMNRGSETVDVIERRIITAKKELEEVSKLSFFQKKLVNDDFEKMYEEFKKWLQEKYPKFKFI